MISYKHLFDISMVSCNRLTWYGIDQQEWNQLKAKLIVAGSTDMWLVIWPMVRDPLPIPELDKRKALAYTADYIIENKVNEGI